MHPILLMDRDGDIWLMYPDEPDTLWFAPDDDKANPRAVVPRQSTAGGHREAVRPVAPDPVATLTPVQPTPPADNQEDDQ